ncbi:integrase core domain protein [Tepidibacillus sp. HK-1]|nr:integrase core domain protein [Tepidibacillus sp. HK-1]
MMYENGYGEIVDYWLEEDMRLRKKERRTRKKIYEQLRDEYNFPGSYRTVCDYIQRRKPQLKLEKEKRHEHLDHPPGEAQVDFGAMTVVKNGAYKDIDVLVLSFPCSNAGFAYPLPAQNTECFLEGLKQLFHQAGGVPTYLRMDNLSAAVVSIGKGDKRVYTDAFLAFQAHYGFEVQPCNPGRGNEKGNVEKKVDYTRNNFFVTAPLMENFKQLAAWLEEKMIQDRKRLHYEKELLIDELWEKEKTKLKALPLKEYPIFTVDKAVVNKYGEITIDKEKVLIPHAPIKQTLIIKKEWNQFSCITSDGEIIYKGPRPYMNEARPIPWEFLFH